MAPMKRLIRLPVLLTLLSICWLLSWPPAADARLPGMLRGDDGTISMSALPPEARNVLAAIRRGGPFPYAKDGTVFGNRERLLPRRPRGYYTEYTVRTPGVGGRGARRIIVGGKPPESGEYWYSDDHYQSFRRIRE